MKIFRVVAQALLLSILASGACNAADYAGAPQVPFSFQENKGQAPREIRYVGRGPEIIAWFFEGGFTVRRGSRLTTIRFENGVGNPEIRMKQPLGATSNEFRGSNSDRWRHGMPLYSVLSYKGIWPGIELRFGADAGSMKAELVAGSAADLSAVRLRLDKKESAHSGMFNLPAPTGESLKSAPVFFAGGGGRDQELGADYQQFEDGSIGFNLSNLNAAALTVDSHALFSGRFGGSSQTNITGVAINSFYNVVVSGWTLSSDLPGGGGFRSGNAGGVDAFVATFSPTGALISCTYLGGSGDDRAFGVAVDASNNIFVTGWTSSANFPVANAVQGKLSGTRDAFVTKLNASASSLIFSTYFGGSGVDSASAIALDSAGAPVIVGDTTSANLATTSGVLQPRFGGGQDAFIGKLSAAGTAISFLTYFGGTGTEHGAALKLDSSDAVVIGGSTTSLNLPTVNAFQPRCGGSQDGFIAKLSSDGKSLLISTYLGGSGGTPGAPEQVTGIGVGPSGNIIAAGTTSSVNFPIVTGAAQPAFGGGSTDGFIVNFSGTSGALRRSTYVGGSLDDGITAVVTDLAGAPIVTGYTVSPDFPIQNARQPSSGGGMDAFILKTGYTQTLYSSYLGGSGGDQGNAIALDSLGSIVVVGSTSSGDFPSAGSMNAWTGGSLSGFVTRIAPNFSLAVAAPPTFLFDPWHTTGYQGSLYSSNFGANGDIPISGDWDGTGKKRIGVFRNGLWILDINGNGVFDAGDKQVAFGQTGDFPVVGDWNGTGRIKLGLFRQGTFILDLSGHLSGISTGVLDASFSFGLPGDIPVASDWNRSGPTKVGVFRNGLWLVDYNGDRVFNSLDRTFTYGQAGDIPVLGDWSSLGTEQIGLYRHGLWILDYDGDRTIYGDGRYEMYIGFGGAGYYPLIQ